MLGIVYILLLCVHLFAVNFATVAPFLAILFEWRGTRSGDSERVNLAQWLAGRTLAALALAIIAGLFAFAVAWARGSEHYFAGLLAYRHRLEMGVAELGVSLLLFFFYWWPWQWWGKHRGWHRLIGFASATNLAYHFPVLFVVLGYVSTRPELWENSPRFITLLAEPQCLAALIHFFLASVAVTGIALVGYALRLGAQITDTSTARELIRLGGWLALIPSALQLLAGFYYLLQLPDASRKALMGGEVFPTAIFATSLFAVFLLLQRLFVLALGDATRRDCVRAMMWMGTTVLLMVAARHASREAAYEQLPLPVDGQSPFVEPSSEVSLSDQPLHGVMGSSYPVA